MIAIAIAFTASSKAYWRKQITYGDRLFPYIAFNLDAVVMVQLSTWDSPLLI